LDNSLKMAKLQKDLREIDDVNIDYSNYEGK
jgi:hypothetical protein